MERASSELPPSFGNIFSFGNVKRRVMCATPPHQKQKKKNRRNHLEQIKFEFSGDDCVVNRPVTCPLWIDHVKSQSAVTFSSLYIPQQSLRDFHILYPGVSITTMMNYESA